jgi:hypothetical protein
MSFRRIADIPFDAYIAALDSWQLTGHRGELRLGNSRLRGPAERDPHFGTTRIEVRLAHGPLRPPMRMRLEIEPWSPTATALELIPCQAQIRRSGGVERRRWVSAISTATRHVGWLRQTPTA